MKQTQKGSGRRGSTAQVHHKEIRVYQVGQTIVYSLFAIVVTFAIVLL